MEKPVNEKTEGYPDTLRQFIKLAFDIFGVKAVQAALSDEFSMRGVAFCASEVTGSSPQDTGGQDAGLKTGAVVFKEIAAEIEKKVTAKWLEDGCGKMNPVEFVRKYYTEWLDNPCFVRAHLAHNEGLEAAYIEWVSPKCHFEDSLWPGPDSKGKEHKAALASMTRKERTVYNCKLKANRQTNYIKRLRIEAGRLP